MWNVVWNNGHEKDINVYKKRKEKKKKDTQVFT